MAVFRLPQGAPTAGSGQCGTLTMGDLGASGRTRRQRHYRYGAQLGALFRDEQGERYVSSAYSADCETEKKRLADAQGQIATAAASSGKIAADTESLARAGALVAECERRRAGAAPSQPKPPAPRGRAANVNATPRSTVDTHRGRAANLDVIGSRGPVSPGGGAMTSAQQDYLFALAIGQQQQRQQPTVWPYLAFAGVGVAVLVLLGTRRFRAMGF